VKSIKRTRSWTNNTNWNSAAPVSDWFGVTVEGNSVTQINLAGNNLVGSIPSEIGDFVALTQLNLGAEGFPGNNLTGDIPTSIGNLSSLEYLQLAHNSLTGIIPAEIGNFTHQLCIPDNVGEHDSR